MGLACTISFHPCKLIRLSNSSGYQGWIHKQESPKSSWITNQPIEAIYLVVSTHLKNISQIGSFPLNRGENKHIWNHHLGKIKIPSSGQMIPIPKFRFPNPLYSFKIYSNKVILTSIFQIWSHSFAYYFTFTTLDLPCITKKGGGFLKTPLIFNGSWYRLCSTRTLVWNQPKTVNYF